jgi:hypothetical protein
MAGTGHVLLRRGLTQPRPAVTAELHKLRLPRSETGASAVLGVSSHFSRVAFSPLSRSRLLFDDAALVHPHPNDSRCVRSARRRFFASFRPLATSSIALRSAKSDRVVGRSDPRGRIIPGKQPQQQSQQHPGSSRFLIV